MTTEPTDITDDTKKHIEVFENGSCVIGVERRSTPTIKVNELLGSKKFS